MFSHFNTKGEARMVDIKDKALTFRRARASGQVVMQKVTLEMIKAGAAKKGDVLAVARIAAIQGAKQTAHLIPLCHALALSSVEVDFDFLAENILRCTVTAETTAGTGVEMEALTGVTLALLTVYDMCKAVDRGMVVESIMLLEKSGGKSGRWQKT